LRAFLMWRYTPCVNPSHGRIDALSYQLDFVNLALRKYYEEGAVRLMLADDVGLGKTVMTGLLIKELMLRGHVKRVLLVVPRFLKFQWRRELKEKFDIECSESLDGDCAVASIDWVKRHVEEVATRRWDMVVFDEAHNLTKRRRATMRYEAALRLASSIRNVLLLTATPHHGDREDFLARLKLLDNGIDDVRTAVREYVVRRLREDVRDEVYIPDRDARRVEIRLSDAEKAFYEGVENYARYYYNLSQGKGALALVALVFLKRASSSVAAALKTLERRAEALREILKGAKPVEKPRRLRDLMKVVADADPHAVKKELEIVERLIELGKSLAVDTKVEKLVEELHQHGGDKCIVFTQYRDTMRHVAQALRKRGFKVVELHGGMDEEERKRAESDFRKWGEVLVATDAASEGLNLQVANVLVNFDLPWNPTRLDQRIGRVHRYGQTKDVFVYNFLVEDTIDGKIYDVLLRKIEAIKRDLGKVFDYLGNAMDEASFLRAVKRALEGRRVEEEVEKVVERKVTLKELEDLLASDRIRIERDPRCKDYVTDEELKNIVLPTLAALDPRSYAEEGDGIKVKYVPRELQRYCRGVCTTGLAGFGLSTPCPEKITIEHPLVQAVISYHLEKLGKGAAVAVEVDKPCLSTGTTWIYKASVEISLPIGLGGDERKYVIEDASAFYRPEELPRGCNVEEEVGFTVLSLPIYAAPAQSAPEMPPELVQQVKERLKERVQRLCDKITRAIQTEVVEQAKQLAKKRLPPRGADNIESELLRKQLALIEDIQRRCEAAEPSVETLLTLIHRPLGYSALGLEGAKIILGQGQAGEEIVIEAEKAQGCQIRDLRSVPMAGVDFISICPDEIRLIEVKTVAGPNSQIHIQPVEWSTMCANKRDLARKSAPHTNMPYKELVKSHVYLYIVDLAQKTVLKYKNPCQTLREIVTRYAVQQTKYIIPYTEFTKLITPTEVIRYAT